MNESTNALTWLREQLARYTYRPGWSLTIEPGAGMFDGARIIVDYQTADSRDPSRTIPIRGSFVVPLALADMRDADLFARWLLDVLFEAERHESREWLRRDGRIYDDPHDENGRR